MSDDAPREPRRRRWTLAHEEVLVAILLLGAFLFFFLRIDDFVIGRRGTFLSPTFWPSVLLALGAIFSAGYLMHALLDLRNQRREGTTQDADPAGTEPVGTEPAGATAATDSSAAEAGPSPVTVAKDHPVIDEDEDGRSRLHHIGKTVAGAALLALYIWLLGPIGFIPATFLFTLAFLILAGERRWWMLTAFPVGTTVVVVLVFTQLLTVALPRGRGIFVTLSTYLY